MAGAVLLERPSSVGAIPKSNRRLLSVSQLNGTRIIQKPFPNRPALELGLGKPRSASIAVAEKPCGSIPGNVKRRMSTGSICSAADDSVTVSRVRDRLNNAVNMSRQVSSVSDEQSESAKEEALRALEEAMKVDGQQSLQAGIRQARLAGIHTDEIREAERIYKKRDAMDSLMAAIEAGESGGIKMSIQVAMQAGNDASVLQQGIKALQDIEKRRFKQSVGPVGMVEVDVSPLAKQDAEVVGKLGDCLENLRHAINVRETSALKMAINVARPFMAHVPEVVDCVKEAQRILGATESYRLLHAAERAKKPDVSKLRDAISKAEQFGVEESAISACRNRFQQLEAGEGLSNAILKKDSAALQDAILKAQEFGFDDKAKIAKAEKCLLLSLARKALQAAVNGISVDNVELLQLAVEDAKAAGVEKRDIGLAELTLRSFQKVSEPGASIGRRASVG